MSDTGRDDGGWEGSLEALSDTLGHRFGNSQLLVEALTHRSATHGDNECFDYERLEFLGDRVLGLVVADLLMETYPEEAEGTLARRFTGLVRREALEKVAESLDLGRFLRLSEGEERTGGRDNPGIQANACEAIIGALYRDGGLDVARRFILTNWEPLMAEAGSPARDAKTRLQEWAQARKVPLPRYTVVKEEGPSHEPVFTIEVSVRGLEPARATAGSKRRAEQDAAAALLEGLGSEADDMSEQQGQGQ
jgi:ribonuclease-3